MDVAVAGPSTVGVGGPGGAAPEELLEQGMQTGDVLLFRGTKVFSRFIRWVTRSPYSHVALVVRAGSQPLVAQCGVRGVEVLPAAVAVAAYRGQVEWWRPAGGAGTALRASALVEASLEELGKPFALWPLLEVLGYLLCRNAWALHACRRGRARRFCRRVWTYLARSHATARRATRHPSPPGYFCSQFVARCFRLAGVEIVPRRPDHRVAPGDLARSRRLVFQGVLRPHLPVERVPAPPPRAVA